MDAKATASPADVATAVFDALNRRDLDVLTELAHPDVVDDFVAIEGAHGAAGVRAFLTELFEAFPDIRLEVDHIVEDEGRAVVHWRANGTFTGRPFQGIHATGRSIELRGCHLMRVEDGLLRYNTIRYEGLRVTQGAGKIPRQGTAADKAKTAAFNAGGEERSRLRRGGQSMPG